MKTRVLVLPALLALSMTAAVPGGWAVITVQDLPSHLVVDQPTELRFKVRQHGVETMTDLAPKIIAHNGKDKVQRAAAHKGGGIYAATVTVPHAGNWEIEIVSGFMRADIMLEPLHAVHAAAKPIALPEPVRGKHLFVAKGCITCHARADVKNNGVTLAVGPELTGKRFAPDYLKAWLADPSIRPPTNPQKRMPNMELKPQEIAALVTYLNGGSAGVAVK